MRYPVMLLASALLPLRAAAAPLHRLDIENRVPRFQAFYAAATKAPSTEAARWDLWRKDDGIAAVPPGKAGDGMARKLVDAAWSRYAALEPRLPTLTKTAAATARALFAEDNSLLEGLAMRTAQRAVLGLPDAAYTEMPGDSGWMRGCVAKKAAILAGIAGDLDKSGAAIAMKYTFGDGNTGMHREAYCAAWFVVGRMLGSGKSLADLARIPEDRMVAAIRAAL